MDARGATRTARRTARVVLPILTLLATRGVGRAQGQPPSTAGEAGTLNGPIVALELGLGGVRGATDVFGPGLGKAFVLGYRLGNVHLEWHLAQDYRTLTDAEGLRADRTPGDLAVSSVGARYVLGTSRVAATAFVGVTRVSVPLLTLAPASADGSRAVEVERLVGIGALGGLGAGVYLPGTTLLVYVEARAALASFEQPGREYVTSVTRSGDGYAPATSTEDLSPVPWTLALGVRALL